MLKMMTEQAGHRWIQLWGSPDPAHQIFAISGAKIVFKGYESRPTQARPPIPIENELTPGPVPPSAQQPGQSGHGVLLSNRRFAEGSISVDVQFSAVESDGAIAEIVLYFDPMTNDQLNIGLGAFGGFAAFRRWSKQQIGNGSAPAAGAVQQEKSQPFAWQVLAAAGTKASLSADAQYHVQATVRGSTVRLAVNDVDLLETSMPFPLPDRQVGIFAQSRKDIQFENFTVTAQKPRVFVAMQFNVPEYDALYRDVIAPVCDAMDLEAYRADETNAPGLVVADIARQIRESRIIIAELSSGNPNVLYEVGYADAIQKPVILVADRKARDLPFDVRPYRTLFYENSIGGKKAVEASLTKYLQTILGQTTLSAA